MEILLTILVVSGGIVSAYALARTNGLKHIIDAQNETNAALKADLREWQNLALAKQGMTKLGFEPPPPSSDGPLVVKPTVVMRQQGEARYYRQSQTATPEGDLVPVGQTVANGNGVSWDAVRRAETLKKAAEILEKDE
jgi:hypothetical protein